MVADLALAWSDLAHKLAGEGPQFLRLATACVLGGLIGLERGLHGQPAGLRTHMLVCVGSALAMVVSLEFAGVFGNAPAANLHVDPARVAYGVMGGIGFLGAGAIMRYGLDVHGLTTAASLWCIAAIGLACGFGMYTVAIFATLLVLLVLWGLKFFEQRLPRPAERTLIVSAAQQATEPARRLIEASGIQVQSSALWYQVEAKEVRATYHVRILSEKQAHDVVDQLSRLPDVRQVRLQ
jgi:putative Mg2+ transporter-C (MgtC) family protein